MGKAHAVEVEAAGQNGRARHRMRLGAPDVLAGVREDQHQGVGEKQLIEFFALVHIAEQEALHDAAEDGDAERGDHHRAQEADRRPPENKGHVPGDVGADHVEGAVGEVDDLQDPEDQRQARRDEEQEHRGGQARAQLAEQEDGVQQLRHDT